MLTAKGARPPPALAHRGPLPLSARSPLIQAATRCGLHSLTGSIPPGSPPASSPVRVKPKQQLHLNSGVSQRRAAHADSDDDFRSADRKDQRDGRTHAPAVPCALRPPRAPLCRCARVWGRVSGYRYVGHAPRPLGLAPDPRPMPNPL